VSDQTNFNLYMLLNFRLSVVAHYSPVAVSCTEQALQKTVFASITNSKKMLSLARLH